MRWQDRAVCRQVDPEIFHPKQGESGDLGVHHCRTHCPVLEECAEWAQQWTWRECVIAGQRWTQTGLSRAEARPVCADECSLCAGVVVHPARMPARTSRRNLRPCGTPAAYRRHRERGERPCDECDAANREYQRDRKRTERANRAAG